MAHPSPAAARVPRWPFWIGFVFLLFYACLEAVLGPAPFDTRSILLVFGSILLGTLLLLAPDLVDWLHAESARKSRAAVAGPTLTAAVARLEECVERVRQAQEESAKSILIARQVPERIGERLLDLQRATENRQEEDLRDLRNELDTRRQVDLAAFDRVSSAAAEAVRTLRPLTDLPARLQVLEHLLQNPPTAPADPAPPAAPDPGPALAGLREELRALQAQIAELPGRLPSPAAAPAIPTAPDPEPALAGLREELRALQAQIAELPGRLPSPAAAPATLPAAGEPAPPATESANGSERRSRPKKEAKPDPQRDLFEESPDPHRVTLVAEAMIGVTNRLFLRGDEPWLGWERGQPMELIGIGRWKWSLDGLREPVQCRVWRNDTDPASGAEITLKPGSVVTVHPSFDPPSAP